MFSELNECESNPCENGDACEDEINAYTCVCIPGYTAKTCDKGTLHKHTLNTLKQNKNKLKIKVNVCRKYFNS